ncbi:hypothetical protein [Streptomyces nojiriensis]|uniref:hypothetical protein n=1 Tax=Streptomyces nojiriensis TaxID=66374 RepID=UPI00364C27BA
MTLRGAGRPRQLLPIACAVVALAAVVLGWYATRTVRPDCTYAISALTDGNGHNMPDENGRVWSYEELADRGYRQAVESGRCAPPRARWQTWIG